MKHMTRVAHRALPLTEPDWDRQVKHGLYTTYRGERLAIPVDSLRNRETYLHRELWRQDAQGRVFRPGVRFAPMRTHFQKRTLAWLRDHVHPSIPRYYYTAALGHDLHVSTWGELYGRHWHHGWANPFEPDKLDPPLDPTFHSLFATHWVDHECDLPVCPRDLGLTLADLPKWGFTEDLGLLSQGKVTDAFVSEEIDELVSSAASEYADFDFHEVGTSNQAEDNNDTALIATSGIARETGSPTDVDPIYRNVATITADATETWEEHGIFNNVSGAALMDRSLTGGQSVNSPDTIQYTFNLTKNPEA